MAKRRYTAEEIVTVLRQVEVAIANDSPNSRLNPTRASSPVDLECRIPAKCAFFRHRGRESRKLKTRWRSGWDSN